MSDIITKFQNKEIDIVKACLDYEEQKSSLTKTKANTVYNFLQEELKKCHIELCKMSGNEHLSHEDCADPQLGYPFYAPPFGVLTYIRKK